MYSKDYLAYGLKHKSCDVASLEILCALFDDQTSADVSVGPLEVILLRRGHLRRQFEFLPIVVEQVDVINVGEVAGVATICNEKRVGFVRSEWR